ncbi:MAG: GNAT family N-acetyltransferase [Candidatus Aenigmarchaeota archaeon]|nr:GNAT family N-acetyltransferase [Candidatus Aenigmarchaeota archaeon]
MKFKPGQLIKTSWINDEKVSFRCVKAEDTYGLLNHLNGLVKEKAFIGLNRVLTRREGIKFVEKLLESMKEGDVPLIIEVNKKVVGWGDLRPGRHSRSHVAEIILSIDKKYRKLGIGTRMIKLLIEIAKSLKIKIISLTVVANNIAARNLYKKLGFKEVGKIPEGRRYGNKYYDEILMVKKLVH